MKRTKEKGPWQLLLFWPVYFLAFCLLELWVPAEKCRAIHCALDDRIPFCEWFLIPYALWYISLAAMTLYTFFRDEEVFCKFMSYLMITAAGAFVCFFLFPSRQELRPVAFPRENALTEAVRLLYRMDTNTNVFPSLHVLHALGIWSAGIRAKGLQNAVWKWLLGITTILICLSTVFLRQHSVMDVVCALPISAWARQLCFGGRIWVNSLKKKTV